MKGLGDLVIFGRVISLGFLTGGTIWLAVLLARELMSRGWPQWSQPLVIFGGVLLALGGAWREIRSIQKSLVKKRQDTEKKERR